jgi:hypothetical protein
MARELGFEVVNAPAPIGNPPQGLISYIIDNYVPGAGGN